MTGDKQVIRVDQRWRSRDRRDNDRTVTVVRVVEQGDANTVLVETTARRSVMRCRTLRTRYRLVYDPQESV